MSKETPEQQNYWDKEINRFDSIYSHEKSGFSNFLDSMFRWDMYKRFDYTMENAEPIQNRSFLDVGCGTGRYSLEFAHRNAQKVVGIDTSAMMIETCQQRALNEQLDNICSFIQMDLIEYESDSGFDVCIAIGLFDYIKEPLPVLKKMSRITQDKAIMTFPRSWTWRAAVRKIRLYLKGCNVYFYTMADVDNLLRKAGFGRYNCQKIGQLYCVTAFPEQGKTKVPIS